MGTMPPQQLLAVTPQEVQSSRADETVSIDDIALDSHGTFRGQVFSENGTPASEITIHVLKNGRALTTVTTDREGQFEISGLRGGVYQLMAGDSVVNYRVWAPRTAPPAAQQFALLVDDHGLVRAQDRPLLRFLTNPWVLGAGIAAAIAIPLALDDDEAS
jgi:hypothetical protein